MFFVSFCFGIDAFLCFSSTVFMLPSVWSRWVFVHGVSLRPLAFPIPFFSFPIFPFKLAGYDHGMPLSKDIAVQRAVVNWNLRGMLLLNLTTALCTSPTMHQTMPLRKRVENALTGFVLLDLWKVVSDRMAAQKGLPKGSLQIASQTRHALQSVSMSVLLVALTKNEEGSPWSHGHGRLTELGIEEFFGRVRVQSSSAQHTARSFWKASAREMLSRASKEIKDLPPQERLKPVSAEEFSAASSRAYKSALRLVSMCSNFTEESLKSTYEILCEGGHIDPDQSPLHPFEDDAAEVGQNGPEQQVEELQDVLDVMHHEAAMDDEDIPDDSKLGEGAQNMDLRDVPDADQLVHLIEHSPADGEAEVPGPQPFADDPETLLEAVQSIPSVNPCMVGLFDQVWRLTMYLRHWPLRQNQTITVHQRRPQTVYSKQIEIETCDFDF